MKINNVNFFLFFFIIQLASGQIFQTERLKKRASLLYYNGIYPNDWWEYDMDNDTWFQLQTFPGYGRNHPAMIPVNNKIYVGCGSNSNGNLGDWWEYDVITDEWSQKSDLIGYNRHHPYYFGIGDYAYIGFGHGSDFGPGSNPSSNSYISVSYTHLTLPTKA